MVSMLGGTNAGVDFKHKEIFWRRDTAGGRGRWQNMRCWVNFPLLLIKTNSTVTHCSLSSNTNSSLFITAVPISATKTLYWALTPLWISLHDFNVPHTFFTFPAYSPHIMFTLHFLSTEQSQTSKQTELKELYLRGGGGGIYKGRHRNGFFKQGSGTMTMKMALQKARWQYHVLLQKLKVLPIWVQSTKTNRYNTDKSRICRQHTKKKHYEPKT
jgi:hypothetical protein